jgi:hypothetical protein
MQAAVARIYDLTVYFIVTPERFRMAAKTVPRSLLVSVGSTLLSSRQDEKIILGILCLNGNRDLGLGRSWHSYQSQWKFLYRSLDNKQQR